MTDIDKLIAEWRGAAQGVTLGPWNWAGRNAAWLNRCSPTGISALLDTIEALKKERDTLATAYKSEKDASAHYRDLAARKSNEKVGEFRRAEAAESDLFQFMHRLDARWFLTQGWFPKSMTGEQILRARAKETTHG